MAGLEPITWSNERMEDIERAALAYVPEELRQRLERVLDDVPAAW